MERRCRRKEAPGKTVSRFDPQPTLVGLHDFQRATVDYIIRRFYEDDQPTRRFLLADPVGMGKTYVARGVIARAIERLEVDASIGRIDVVYVCSNSDIAAQNIRRLDVSGSGVRMPSRRLTLLATQLNDLDRKREDGGKTVNLVAFTPGTSFELAGQGGTAQERALIHLLLAEHYQLPAKERTASKRLFQGGVQTLSRFQGTIDFVNWQLESGIDQNIVCTFLHDASRSKVGHRYRQLVSDLVGRTPTEAERGEAREVVGELRSALARASIAALEPDLVILDEFQRFKHLLDRDNGGEAADLAHHLFEYPDARVLLLSATPYKMFTLAEEDSLGENHYQDFLDTVRFLGGSAVAASEIAADFAVLRSSLVQGVPTGEVAGRLSDKLRKVMCRTERPDLDGHGMLAECLKSADDISSDDLLGYVALRNVAGTLDAPVTVEYWKSAPYFVNFADGYKLGALLRSALDDEVQRDLLRSLLRAAPQLDRYALRLYKELDLANAKLRVLGDQTVGAGWWKLLWLPPSMQYYRLGGPWSADEIKSGMTKRLIFSSWAAAPTAIASLLSYHADRLAAEQVGTENTSEARRRTGGRLDFHIVDGRPGAMTTLSLFWPFPSLASMCDPLALARQNAERVPSVENLLAWATDRVRGAVGGDGSATVAGAESGYWTLPLRVDDQLQRFGADIDIPELVEVLAGTAPSDADDKPDPVGLTAHVRYALEVMTSSEVLAARPPDLTRTIALLGAASPGNVAWRGLGRIIKSSDPVTAVGHWRAAAVLASGFRTLFNRPESTMIIDRLLARREPYWRNVLAYCAWGGLQAVVDEYLHHLAEDEGLGFLDDTSLLQLAQRARAAIALRPATYRAFDPLSHEGRGIPFLSRFAVRYGTLRQRDEDARLPELRSAFNSPFRPFVLASTSIGQEGVDFHFWCHAIVHWNTPPNPVDFEQREGRITRYKGHAVRRNIGAKQRTAAMSSHDRDPWAAAFAAAAAERPSGKNDLFPYWVYPGDARIERHVPYLPLSRDLTRYKQLRDSLTLYRLAFGQPRQEDLLALLKRGGAPSVPEGFTGLIDLRPPSSDQRQSS